MLHETYHDPIFVQVIFQDKNIRPVVFRWGNHVYQIRRVLNVHSTFSGRERLHFFSVATETEFFKLEFQTETMKWFLLEHYQA